MTTKSAPIGTLVLTMAGENPCAKPDFDVAVLSISPQYVTVSRGGLVEQYSRRTGVLRGAAPTQTGLYMPGRSSRAISGWKIQSKSLREMNVAMAVVEAFAVLAKKLST